MVSVSVRFFSYSALLLLGFVAQAKAGEEFVACYNYRFCFVGPCPSYDVIFLHSGKEPIFFLPDSEMPLFTSWTSIQWVLFDAEKIPRAELKRHEADLKLGRELVYEGYSSLMPDGPLTMHAQHIVRVASEEDLAICP
ncbi:hypothetical protein ACRQ1B_02250 [Rhizobium panacihumi]|uniref:hypothetical protein n=1 Tax=Rhizobium panacihumi TaxID=2008450 RepID=UPI003D7B7CCF